MVDLVIYDLDGTIVEFKLDFVSMKNEFFKFLCTKPIPSSLLDPQNKTSTILKQLRAYLVGEEWDDTSISSLFKEIFSIIERYEWDAAKITNLIPGVLETIRTVHETEIMQAVWTNCPKKIADYTLKKFNLESYFKAVQGRDELMDMKPAPDGLHMLLEKLSINPKNTLMVGDSTIDMIPAVKAGVTAIGITSGPATQEELELSGALKVLNSIKQLPTVIYELKK